MIARACVADVRLISVVRRCLYGVLSGTGPVVVGDGLPAVAIAVEEQKVRKGTRECVTSEDTWAKGGIGSGEDCRRIKV